MRNIPHEDKELAKKQLDFLKVQLFALRYAANGFEVARLLYS